MIARHRSFGVPASQIVRLGLYLISVGVFLGKKTACRILRSNSINLLYLAGDAKKRALVVARNGVPENISWIPARATLKEFYVCAKEIFVGSCLSFYDLYL